MKIEKVTVEPMSLSYEPEFHITVWLSFQRQNKIPIKFNGYLFLERYRIAFLHEYEAGHGRTFELMSTEQAQYVNFKDRFVFVAPLSRRVLEVLDDERRKERKGELQMNMKLSVTSIESTFSVYMDQVGDQRINSVSTGGNSILKTGVDHLTYEIRIPASDWLHDFCPVLENGRYQLLELPIPSATISESESELDKRLGKVIDSLPLMEIARLEGDWNRVIKDSRKKNKLLIEENE